MGTQMAELPVDPQHAKMLIAAPGYRCTNEMLSIVALLNVAQIFMRPKEAAKVIESQI